jgi:hypothetical protein
LIEYWFKLLPLNFFEVFLKVGIFSVDSVLPGMGILVGVLIVTNNNNDCWNCGNL